MADEACIFQAQPESDEVMFRKPKTPLEWHDVDDTGGTVLGRYAVDGRMIVVQSAKGWEKRTQVGNPDAVGGLARMMLLEGPPASFGRI